LDKAAPSSPLNLRPPESEQEWKAYFELRWQILRAPWNQPQGSEKDELETSAWHVAAFIDNHKLIATGRLHKINKTDGQIRYMAVSEAYQSQGIGCLILKALESQARQEGLNKIVLNARESAVDFYQKQGYQVAGREHTLFGSIHHFRMEKSL
jgi:N-acetylglutamate synthase-like GNAT family acetyltransferase